MVPFPHSSPDTSTPPEAPQQQYTQEQVNYRPAGGSSTRCGNCAHYMGNRTCAVVSGDINPDGVSDAYTPAGNSLTDLVQEPPR